MIDIEESLREQDALDRLPSILQQHVPELQRIAFSFKFYGHLKIASKDSVCITQLMGLTEKTVTKYINQAIDIIKQRLKT